MLLTVPLKLRGMPDDNDVKLYIAPCRACPKNVYLAEKYA